MELHGAALPKHQLRDLKKGKFKCWGTREDVAVLLCYLRCGSVCNTVVFRALGKGKAEREGGSCCWKCAAAAVTSKELFLEKGEQKGRQQKSVEAVVVQRGQRGSAAHWSCGVDRDHIPVRWDKVAVPHPALQWWGIT